MKRKTMIHRSLLIAGLLMISSFGMTQVEVGVRAGLNLSTVSVKEGSNRMAGAKHVPGFHAGMTFDIPVAPNFYIQPGALFTTKGAELRKDAWFYYWPDQTTYYDGDYTRLTSYYFEVPLNFIYKLPMPNGRLFFGAGPYVAYGLGGKYKDNYDGAATTGKLEFINDWDDKSSDDRIYPYGKPVDFGLNVLGGYEFANRFSVQLNGGVGLANIEPNSSGSKPNNSMKNSTVGISVGYKF